MTRSRSAAWVLAMSSLILLASCSSSHHAAVSSGSGTPAQSASTSAGPPPVDPLTGEQASNNPVVAVKIEDTALGRPQSGVDKADIVFVEEVEGGLTRLMAIFNSNLPRVVEPVRSARPSDPELALEFGHILFVASGGSRNGIAPLYASPLKPIINDRGDAGFTRDPHRYAPENLEANLTRIARHYHGPTAKSIGLVWSADLANSPTKPGAWVRTRVGGTDVTFHWSPSLHRYVRIIDGNIQHTAAGDVIDTPNVIVQFCRITVYTKDRDVLGNPAQYTHTVGQGRAVLFRDGRQIEGTWHRNSVNDGTTFTATNGKPMALAPGGAWIVLVATKAPLG